jgi:pimeloyl-ACP methyl ester carboxylesterase
VTIDGRRYFVRAGVRLACRDFGGEGHAVAFLHGLAGHADEWTETASWLTAEARVLAFDARGHGRSERHPKDVSHDARVDDVAFVVEQLEVGPVVLVGQSVGGLTALSVAARYASRVRALVLVEASPSDGGDADATAEEVGAALRSWPVPFASRDAATAFFRDRFGVALAAQAWTDGLERSEDGWRPRFDVDVMVETLREELAAPTWSEWEQLSCPVLIVRGERGTLTPAVVNEMLTRLPHARLVQIPDAGHDVHLDQPQQWREALEQFAHSLR